MTTSEFVGHIDDLNTKYDMIYLGDDAEDLNYSETSDQIKKCFIIMLVDINWHVMNYRV